MNLTIEISDENAVRLQKQAEAQGLTLEAWVQELAREAALTDKGGERRAQRTRGRRPDSLKIQKRTQPDPEGWTISGLY